MKKILAILLLAIVFIGGCISNEESPTPIPSPSVPPRNVSLDESSFYISHLADGGGIYRKVVIDNSKITFSYRPLLIGKSCTD